MSWTHPARLLGRIGVPARKSWGQNFLVHPETARNIVGISGVEAGSKVLEIGPGLGALTKQLLETGTRLVAVERDPVLADWLRHRFPGAVIHQGDATVVDLDHLCPGTGWFCVSNLPYNIATPLIGRLLRVPARFKRLVLMLQKELADRILAVPGTSGWGALSLKIQAQANVDRAMKLAPAAFYPRPRVDSVVLVLEPHAVPRTGGALPESFAAVVDAAFSQRRKTVKNALSSRYGSTRAHSALEQAGLDPMARAETMSANDFGRLACLLHPAVESR